MMSRLDADAALDASARATPGGRGVWPSTRRWRRQSRRSWRRTSICISDITDDAAFGEAVKSFLFEQYLRTHRGHSGSHVSCRFRPLSGTILPTMDETLPGPLPPDFLWGAATASYQIEGHPLADGAAPPTGTASPTAGEDSGRHQRGPAATTTTGGEDNRPMKELGLGAYVSRWPGRG